MSAVARGPIHGSAPFARAPHHPAPVRPARRPIGSGTRAIAVTSPARVARRRVPKPPPRKPGMTTTVVLTTSILAIALSAAALGISAAVDTPPTLMSPIEFAQMKRGIEAQTRLALGRCRDVEGAQRDVCKASARAEERIMKADLEARYYGTVAAQAEARTARVRAAYEVARARCTAQLPDERLSCMRAAREERNRELVEVRMPKA